MGLNNHIHKIYAAARNKVWLALFKYTYDDRAIYKAVVTNQKVYDKQAKAMKPTCKFSTPDIAIEIINQLKPLRKFVGMQPMDRPVTYSHLLRMETHEPGHLTLSIVRETTEAKTRKLAARSQIIQTKMSDKMLAVSIAQELTTHALDALADLATNEIIDVLGTSEDVAQRIMLRFSQSANDIARDTRRGAGNAVVITPALHKKLSGFLFKYAGAAFEPANPDLSSYTGLSHLGTMNGTMELFVDDHHDGDDATALIAYKGISDSDAGYLFNPYVLVMPSGEIAVGDKQMISTMTRFGEVADDVAPTYYRKLTFNF